MLVISAPWSAEKYPDVAEWIRRNEGPLALLIEGSSRPECYWPVLLFENDVEPLMFSYNTLISEQTRTATRETARLLCARAMQRLAADDRAGVEESLLACHNFARHVARGQSLVELLQGAAIESMAFEADAAFAHHAQLSRANAKRYRERLRNLLPFPSLADRIDFWERFAFLDLVGRIALHGGAALGVEGGAFPKVLVDWNVPLRRGNEMYGQMAQAARAPTRAERKRRFDDFDRRLDELQERSGDFLRIFTDRSGIAADFLLALLLPATRAVSDLDDRRLTTADLVQLAFALAACRADHGFYPATLAELAPRYIDAIPEDLFSGKPLIYRPTADGTGYLLYSVGPNETDDGGRSDEDDPAGDDLVIRTPTAND